MTASSLLAAAPPLARRAVMLNTYAVRGILAGTKTQLRHIVYPQPDETGAWDGKRLLSAEWIRVSTTPSPVKPDYGYLWWLNTGRDAIPAAPESAFWAAGFGGNHVYVDRVNDLVIVVRWTPDISGIVERVLGAMRDRPPTAN